MSATNFSLSHPVRPLTSNLSFARHPPPLDFGAVPTPAQTWRVVAGPFLYPVIPNPPSPPEDGPSPGGSVSGRAIASGSGGGGP